MPGLLLDLAGRRLGGGFALLDVPAERDDLPGAEAGLLVPEQHLGFAVAGDPGQQAEAGLGQRHLIIVADEPHRPRSWACEASCCYLIRIAPWPCRAHDDGPLHTSRCTWWSIMMAIQVPVGSFLLLSDDARLIGWLGSAREPGRRPRALRRRRRLGRQRGAAGGRRRAEPGGECRVGRARRGRRRRALADPPAGPAPPHRRRPGRGCRRPGWRRWRRPHAAPPAGSGAGPPTGSAARTRSHAASRFGTSLRCPRNAASTPSDAARARSSPASGPSPAIASSGGGSRSRQRAAAARSVPKSFCGARRPTARTTGRPAAKTLTGRKPSHRWMGTKGHPWPQRPVWFRMGWRGWRVGWLRDGVASAVGWLRLVAGRSRGRSGGRRLPASAPRGRARRRAPSPRRARRRVQAGGRPARGVPGRPGRVVHGDHERPAAPPGRRRPARPPASAMAVSAPARSPCACTTSGRPVGAAGG